MKIYDNNILFPAVQYCDVTHVLMEYLQCYHADVCQLHEDGFTCAGAACRGLKVVHIKYDIGLNGYKQAGGRTERMDMVYHLLR